MDNIYLFDEVLVLGFADRIGRVAFRGKPANLLEYFQCRDFADLYEKLDGQFDPFQVEPTSPEHIDRSLRLDDGGALPRSQPEGSSGPEKFWRASAILAAQVLASPKWLQLLIVCWRALIIFVRNPGLVATTVAQPILLGGLICLTQYRTGAERPVLFFLVILTIWLGMNNSIRELVRNRCFF